MITLPQTIRLTAAVALSAAALGAAAPDAQAQTVETGTLTCDVASGVGQVVGSRRELTCTFQNTAGGVEVYDGVISRVGIDLGVTNRSTIVWTVVAPAGSSAVRGVLAGDYVGATAQATVGGGAGANVLIGGSERAVTLQPLSVSTQTGLSLAVGAAELTLRLRN